MALLIGLQVTLLYASLAAQTHLWDEHSDNISLIAFSQRYFCFVFTLRRGKTIIPETVAKREIYEN